MQINLSQIDLDRFNIVIAKTFIRNESEIDTAMEEAKKNNVRLLVARCYVSNVNLAQKMESLGFFLVDTLVYYSFDLLKKTIQLDETTNLIRPVKLEESLQVEKIAKRSFKGYFGHYHADPGLDKKTCDDVYSDWAYRSCVERKSTDEVFVLDVDNEIKGFATMRLNNAKEAEGVLFAVDPDMQGKGVYKSFILRGQNWSKEKGALSMIVSTQINNIAVQKVWTRAGFEPTYADYTFHKWLE